MDQDRIRLRYHRMRDARMLITNQAELKSIAFGAQIYGKTREIVLRRVLKKIKECEGNLSRLEAWVGRVEPKDYFLDMARMIYRQTKAEILSLERQERLIRSQESVLQEDRSSNTYPKNSDSQNVSRETYHDCTNWEYF